MTGTVADPGGVTGVDWATSPQTNRMTAKNVRTDFIGAIVKLDPMNCVRDSVGAQFPEYKITECIIGSLSQLAVKFGRMFVVASRDRDYRR